MKKITILSLLVVLLTNMTAQNTEANGEYVPQYEPEVNFNENSPFADGYVPAPQTRTSEDILWKKTLWRMIDMREQVNFPLYYPLKEVNGQLNFFLTVFNLLIENKVYAYEYSDKKEDFSPEKKYTIEQIINETNVDFFETQIKDNGDTAYIINEVDIPSEGVLKFYMKEIWYFDALESSMKFKIEAIAPQLSYIDEDGRAQKKVLYWIPFDQLRPWLAKQPVVVNNMNTTAHISYDDLFQKRKFSGHIYKEDNLQNRSLIEYCKNAEEVRYEQERIENEILNFEMDLWEY